MWEFTVGCSSSLATQCMVCESRLDCTCTLLCTDNSSISPDDPGDVREPDDGNVLASKSTHDPNRHAHAFNRMIAGFSHLS